MSYIETKRNIKKGQVSPIYLIVGTEAFIEKDITNTVIEHVLKEDERDFNLSVFDMKETPIDVAIEDAQTLPFFGDKRVVIVKDAYFLTGQKDDGKVDHDVNQLLEYANNPVVETVLILSVPYEKVDERKKVCKVVKAAAQVVEAKSFDEREMFKWLDEQCVLYEVTITNDAKAKLLQLIGSNLLLMVNELNKLAIYIGKSGTIDHHIVEEMVAKTIEQDIFSLINFIITRKIDKAMELFAELVKRKEEPIKIIALVARQVRIIYHVKGLTQMGYSQKEMASQLKLHPYVVKLAAEQGSTFSSKQLLKLLEQLAEADYQIKSGQKEKRLAVELLIMKFS